MRERLLLLAAASIAFGASLGSGFHFDDYAIFSDPALQSARGWLDVWAPLQTRPLTWFTFWLNRQLGAGDPMGYHLFNLLFHLAAVLFGMGVSALPAAGARGAHRGRDLRPAPDRIRSGGLRLGTRHPAGGLLLLRGALAVARGPSVDRGRVLRRCAARQGGMRGVSGAGDMVGVARRSAGDATRKGGAVRHVGAVRSGRCTRHLGDGDAPRRLCRSARRHLARPVSAGARRGDLPLSATG